jgi:hypothetical protein
VGEGPIIEYLLAFTLEPCAIHELTLLLLPFTHFSPFLSPSTTTWNVLCMYYYHSMCVYVQRDGTERRKRKAREREREDGMRNAQIHMLNELVAVTCAAEPRQVCH